MPIYEFLCEDCNTLFNFFSARVETRKKPSCPKCGRKELERRPATFATLRGKAHESDGDPFEELDDAALERAMSGMAGELEALGDSEDPKRFAQVLRKMGKTTGLEMGPKMEELLGKLESGADLDTLEAEMETDAPEGDEDFEDYFRLKKRLSSLRSKRPRVDKELYFL